MVFFPARGEPAVSLLQNLRAPEYRHQMASQALVLCQDSQVLNVLQAVLAQTGVAATVCTGVSTAQAVLPTGRFNPVIVDCDGIESGMDFIQTVRESGPNFESVALAIVKSLDGMRTAFAAGANLVLWKPLIEEEAARVVRTAQGLSDKRRRRFARVAVSALSYAQIQGLAEPAMITELSEGGMGVQAFEKLKPGRAVRVRFALPGAGTDITASAEVAWADSSGRAGMRFTGLSKEAFEDVRGWMDRGISFGGGARLSTEPVFRGGAGYQIVSALLDTVLVGGATSLFGIVHYLLTRSVPREGVAAMASLVTFIVLWLTYRFVFFRHPATTPGAEAAEHIRKFLFAHHIEDPLELSTSR